MKTPLAAALAALVGAFAAAAATSTAASPSRGVLRVTPSVVHRGQLVLIGGDARDCPVGDAVTAISRAFPHRHEFANIPAVLAKVRAHGLFRASTRIPTRARAGRYLVTARCGGGNLGVAAPLVVLP